MARLFKNKDKEKLASLHEQVMLLNKAVNALTLELAYLSKENRGDSPTVDMLLSLAEELEDTYHRNGGY